MEGVIKFYNHEKNFGFITGDDGKDYFFHSSGVETGNTTKEGDKVSFEVVQGDRGPKAEKIKNVTGTSEKSVEKTEEEAPVEEKSEESVEEVVEEESEDEKEE